MTAPQSNRDKIIVIGTGFGGAVAACRLAQAGFEVLVLERGRRYGPGDFPALPAEPALLPEFPRWNWDHDQGLWELCDLEELISVNAAGYGGGSLIYANVHLRAPDHVFDDRWPQWYSRGANLAPYYDLAASMLEVAPISEHPGLHSALVKADQLKLAAEQLDRRTSHFLPPLTISRRDGPNVHGVEQQQCIGCGGCCTGCSLKAKNTLDLNYLALAEKWGAQIITLCEVKKLEQLGPNDWAVHCHDHATDRPKRFTAPNVFLCAGSVHSTRLLASARLLRPGKAAKALAGVGYFPGGDAIGVVYDTTHAQEPSFGPTITTALVHNRSSGPSRSFLMIEDGGYAEQLDRLIGMLRAPLWVGRNRLSRTGRADVGASCTHEGALAQRQRFVPGPAGPASAVDDVLDALAAGQFDDAVSKQLRDAWPDFVDELKRPLLMRAVVERTIDTGIRRQFEKCFLTRWLNPDRFPGKLLIALFKLIARVIIWMAFGSTEALAQRAMHAILRAAGLPRDEIAREVLGYDARRPAHRTMLLAMGQDAASGVLQWHKGRMVADLNLFQLAPGYAEQERLMTDVAQALGGELRTNPAWAFLGKPITVHNQGGCRMSDDPRLGVTDPDGAVRGCDGLHVLDGALLCTSVGVNPSATILAIAERNVLEFIRSRRGAAWPAGDASASAAQYAEQWTRAQAFRAQAVDRQGRPWDLAPPDVPGTKFRSRPLGLSMSEVMRGYYSPTLTLPPEPEQDQDYVYRELETKGRPGFYLEVALDLRVENLNAFFEDDKHRMGAAGKITLRLPDAAQSETFPLIAAESSMELLVDRDKPYAMRGGHASRIIAQEVASGVYYKDDATKAAQRSDERFMRYFLSFSDTAKQKWMLAGYKRIRNDPGPDLWRATSSLYICLLGPDPAARQAQMVPRGAGVVRVGLPDFTFKQVPSIKVTGTTDPARIVWATTAFASFFFGSLQRVYLPHARFALETLMQPPHHKARG